jgi:hypothetical protein
MTQAQLRSARASSWRSLRADPKTVKAATGKFERQDGKAAYWKERTIEHEICRAPARAVQPPESLKLG